MIYQFNVVFLLKLVIMMFSTQVFDCLCVALSRSFIIFTQIPRQMLNSPFEMRLHPYISRLTTDYVTMMNMNFRSSLSMISDK